MTIQLQRPKAPDLTRAWWIFLVAGILWLVVSVIVLRFTTTSVVTIGIILGIVFLVLALNEAATAAIGDELRWLHVALAVLFLAGSLWAFIRPVDAFWALASVLGILLVLKGSFDLIESILSREVNSLWGLGLTIGILEVLLGFWASQQFYPARAALIIIWVGLATLFHGVGQIVTAFRLRKLRDADQ